MIKPPKNYKRIAKTNGYLNPAMPEAVDMGFDKRWEKHPKPQATTETVFWDKTGWCPDDLKGKTVLDFGCGCGRFSKVVLDCGGNPIGLDGSSSAIKAAAENAPGNNALFLQADLTKPVPMQPKSVDMAFSIGVLHHTKDPAASFANMVKAVRPGGKIAIWVYCKHMSDDTYWPHYHWLHMITSNCPPEILYEACRLYAPAMRNANLGKWGILEQLFRASNSLEDEECVSDTHDWHCPTYRFWHTVDEVKEWFSANGCDIDRIGDFPVCISGTKK